MKTFKEFLTEAKQMKVSFKSGTSTRDKNFGTEYLYIDGDKAGFIERLSASQANGTDFDFALTDKENFPFLKKYDGKKYKNSEEAKKDLLKVSNEAIKSLEG